jgi:hypothetical protein
LFTDAENIRRQTLTERKNEPKKFVQRERRDKTHPKILREQQLLARFPEPIAVPYDFDFHSSRMAGRSLFLSTTAVIANDHSPSTAFVSIKQSYLIDFDLECHFIPDHPHDARSVMIAFPGSLSRIFWIFR